MRNVKVSSPSSVVRGVLTDGCSDPRHYIVLVESVFSPPRQVCVKTTIPSAWRIATSLLRDTAGAVCAQVLGTGEDTYQGTRYVVREGQSVDHRLPRMAA